MCLFYLVFNTANCSLCSPVNGVWKGGGEFGGVKRFSSTSVTTTLLVGEVELIKLCMCLHHTSRRYVDIIYNNYIHCMYALSI